MRLEHRQSSASWLALAALLTLALLVALAPRASAEPDGRFWNGPVGWSHRQYVEVSSVYGGLSDHAIAINVSTAPLIAASKLQADCDDLRFRLADGTSLPYWLESGCGGTARVWVKVPFIPAYSSAPFEMYYGNPTAASESSVNATFLVNSIRVESADCSVAVSNATLCPITNASFANSARAFEPDICTMYTTKVDHGNPCAGTPSFTDDRDRFSVEYRFLFVPDVTGNWVFATRTADWSELAITSTDDQLVTSRTLVVSNYAASASEQLVSLSLTAGSPRWFSLISSDAFGTEGQRIRIARPGGSLQVLSTTAFPTMIFTRDHTLAPVTASFGAEEALPGPPSFVTSVPWVRQVNLTFGAPTYTGGSPILGYRVLIWNGEGWSLGQNVTSNTATLTGLSDGTPYSLRIVPYTTRGYNGSEIHYTAPLGIPSNEIVDGFVATGANRSVTLSWNAFGGSTSNPVHGWKVYSALSPATPTLLATTTNAGNTSFVVHGLANGTAYRFQVRPYNIVGDGAISAALDATPAARPDPPKALVATRADGNVTLSWTPGLSNGAPFTGYQIWRGTAPGAGTLIATTSNGGNTSFKVGGLTNGVVYYFNVTAKNVMGTSATSNEVSARPARAPDAPTLQPLLIGNGTLGLTWSAPASNGGEPLLNYALYQGTDPGGETFLMTLDPSILATSLARPNGVTHYYRIGANNTVGAGINSTERSGAPGTLPYPPPVASTSGGNRSLTIAWSPPANDGGRAILGYRAHCPTCPTPMIDTAGLSATFTGLTNGTSYLADVTAYHTLGEGNSTGWNAATPYAPRPDPPAQLVATRGNQAVTLTWTPGFDGLRPLTGYTIWMSTTSGAETPLATTTNGANTSFLVYGLTNGQTYFFNVTARNALGMSASSNEVTAKPATTPSAPTSMSAAFGNGLVNLAWNAPFNGGGEPISSYVIHAGSSPGSLAPIATIGTNRTFVVNGLTNGQIYYFRVAAANAVGTGPLGSTVSATPARAPDAPLSLTGTAGSREVALHWNAPVFHGGREITNYQVYVAMGAGPLQPHTPIGTNTSYTARGLVDGTQYRFRVAAINAVGSSALSAELLATPLSPPGPPETLTATQFLPDIRLDWTPPANVGGAPVLQYRIYASETPGGARWFVATVDGAALTYLDVAPSSSTRYYVVRALNVAGEGAVSPEALGIATTSLVQPGAPDTYRSCTHDSTAQTAACGQGSAQNVQRVAAGGRHTCVLLQDKRVDCWGDDAFGQSADHLAGQPASAVAAGTSHTCVLLEVRNVDCYGSNAFGKAASYLGGDAVAVAAGGTQTCFLRADASAFCQGSNGYGQAPARVNSVLAIAAGGYHTCFLHSTRQVACVGLNDRGQSAPDTTGDVSSISAGGFHSCALTLSRQVRCWGSLTAPIPSNVQGNALQIASGRDHACARIVGGSVVCWGADRDGQSAGYAGNLAAISISAGDSHTCAVLADANVLCWGGEGSSNYGQAQAYPVPDAQGGAAAQSSAPSPVIPSNAARLARIEEA